jgi:hypothetical protein
MTAHPVFTGYDEDPKRIRAILIGLVLVLATLFLFQAMDGIQQSTEQAERREQQAKVQEWRDGMLRQTILHMMDVSSEPCDGTDATAVHGDPID